MKSRNPSSEYATVSVELVDRSDCRCREEYPVTFFSLALLKLKGRVVGPGEDGENVNGQKNRYEPQCSGGKVCGDQEPVILKLAQSLPCITAIKVRNNEYIH